MKNDYEVIVVGGGMAGCTAAVTAARMGCRTLLVEQFGFLGGWATAALVNPFMSHRTSKGLPLISGFFDELQTRLAAFGGLIGPSFDSEIMKFVLQEAVLEAGVELQLHTFFDRARIADDGKIVARLVSKSPTRWAERSGNVGEILRCAQNDGESQNDESGQNDVRSEGGILRCAQNDGEDKNDEDGWNDVRDWNDEDGWNDVRDWNDEDGWNDEGGRNSAREQVVRCQRLIDCSGDGDAAFSLGADYSTGDENGIPQAATLMFDVGGVDIVKVLSYVRDHPDQMLFPKLSPDADPESLAEGVVSVAGYYDLVACARAAGDYDAPGDMIFFISRPTIGEVVFNTTHVGNVNGTNANDLTRAELEGRKQMMSIVSFVKKYVPGFENSYLLRVAAHVGIRETRRIIGDYVFSAEDVIEGRKFPDCICRLAYPVDVHSGKGEGYTKEESSNKPTGVPPPGDWYEIPFRCLLPRSLENVLVAGRCVSSTQAGHGAIRIMPACIAMGQAAGTAAALSILKGVSPRELDVGLLTETLRKQGAIV